VLCNTLFFFTAGIPLHAALRTSERAYILTAQLATHAEHCRRVLAAVRHPSSFARQAQDAQNAQDV